MTYSTLASAASPLFHISAEQHEIVQEISKRSFWQLLSVRSRDESATKEPGTNGKLVRLVSLPQNLSKEDHQRIVYAVWDSTDSGHEWTLNVLGVIPEQTSIALVHEWVQGGLLSVISQAARRIGRPFPLGILVRIALDIVEGIECGQKICIGSETPFRAGGVALDSLYLCADGRTRTLDSQVLAALLSSRGIRALGRESLTLPPEIDDETFEPDERADVFALSALLVELLSGTDVAADGGPPVGCAIPIVPPLLGVPDAVIRAFCRALSVNPAKRQPKVQDFVLELVLGVGEVATHLEVAEFATALLPLECWQQPDLLEQDEEPRSYANAERQTEGTLSASAPCDCAMPSRTGVLSALADEIVEPKGTGQILAEGLALPSCSPGKPKGRYPSPFDQGFPPLRTRTQPRP